MAIVKIKNKNPSRPPAFVLFDQALALFAEQQYQAADTLIAKGLKLAPHNAALWNLSAACALRLDDAVRAESAWRQALRSEPRNAVFHANLAMLLGELSRLDEAEALCRRALEIDARLVIAHFNLGVVLARAGRAGEAEQAYRQALALEPRHPDAGYNLGVLLAEQQRHADAEPAYRQALAVNPLRIDARVNLGVALSALQRLDEAEACFREALDRHPGNHEAVSNLGDMLMRRSRHAEADRLFASAGRQRSTAAQINLAQLQLERGHIAESEALLRGVLASEPDSLSAQISLGELLDEQGNGEQARTWFRKAMTTHPDSALPFGALAHSLERSGEHEEAERWFRESITKPRDAVISRAVFGAWLLKRGRYEEGFALYEARHAPERTDAFQRPPDTEAARWTGQDLHGCSIVIWPEQGYGDQIQFCRYAAELKARGAVHVVMVTHTPLLDLLARAEAIDEVLGFAEFKARRNAYDYWSYVMSLPLHCGTTINTVPARLPYLSAAPDRVLKWRERLPQNGLRVGLAWKGSKGHKNDRHRSLPSLATLAPLWTVPNTAFVSLQKGQGEEEATAAAAEQRLLNFGPLIDDFADTAAIIEQLDLVITVDTAIAHLAGALNKPCWLLLPMYVDWRWHEEREDSPWYPRCMRLFRQTVRSDWHRPVLQLTDALALLASSREHSH